MMNKKERLGFVENLIRLKKVISFVAILWQVECSAVTLRRDVGALHAITSYTHQGRFITFEDIAKFDDRGIWFYKGIGFTRYENSLELIRELISASKGGITREQLEDILRIQIGQQIQTLLRRDELYRVKVGKKYIYLSEELAKNKKKRIRLLNTDTIEEHYDARVSSADLIDLLKVVLIEHKIEISLKELKRLARKYSLKIPVKKVEQILLRYDLTKKKRHRPLERITT